MRDKLEEVTKQCRNLDRGIVEQQEELEDLLENTQQIINELEHDLNEAVEELNVRLIYVCHFFIKDIFSHTNAFIFNHSVVKTKHCKEDAKRRCLWKERR